MVASVTGLTINLMLLILQSHFSPSLSEDNPGDLTIHCGDSSTSSIVNITYYGDINGMFINGYYEECHSQKESIGHFAIYNINGRDCGFKEINNTKVWEVSVRLQKWIPETSDDLVFRLGCVYDRINTAEYNMTIQADEGVGIYVPGNTVNTENIVLKPYHIKDTVFEVLSELLHQKPSINLSIIDEGTNPVSALYPSSEFRLRFSFHSILAAAFHPPVIISCNVTDSQTSPTFHRPILRNGCGDNNIITNFTTTESSQIDDVSVIRCDSNSITIPSSWPDLVTSVYFICEVHLCEVRLPCNQRCPIDISYVTTDSDKVFVVKAISKELQVRSVWIPDDTTPDPIDEPKYEALGSKVIRSWNYVPYLVITVALIVLLVIFGVILLRIVREQMLSNKRKDLDILQRTALMNKSRSSVSDLDNSKTKRSGMVCLGDSGIGVSDQSMDAARTPQRSDIRSINHSTPRRVSFIDSDQEGGFIRSGTCRRSLPTHIPESIPLLPPPLSHVQPGPSYVTSNTSWYPADINRSRDFGPTPPAIKPPRRNFETQTPDFSKLQPPTHTSWYPAYINRVCDLGPTPPATKPPRRNSETQTPDISQFQPPTNTSWYPTDMNRVCDFGPTPLATKPPRRSSETQTPDFSKLQPPTNIYLSPADINRVYDFGPTPPATKPPRRNSGTQTPDISKLPPPPDYLLRSGPCTVDNNTNPWLSVEPVARHFGGVGISKDTHEVQARHTGKNATAKTSHIMPLLPPLCPLNVAPQRTGNYSIGEANHSSPFPFGPASRLDISGLSSLYDSRAHENNADRNMKSFVSPNPTMRPSASTLVSSTKL